MVSELVIEKIEDSIKNSDVVQLKVLNDERFFFYKGFFIKTDFKNDIVTFHDVIKEKIVLNVKDIHEIVTIQKEGAKLLSAWEMYKSSK